MKKTETIVLKIVSLYLVGCVAQNILAVKTFEIGSVSITTAGSLISWAVFAGMDIITEIKGKRFAVKCFTLGMLINLAWNVLCQIAIALPGNNPFVDDCYAVVLGTGWRIATASALAFWIGNYINATIMAQMKKKHKETKFCLRAIVSTICGQLCDNAIFYALAFSPVGISGTIEMPVRTILCVAVITTAIETAVESVVSPVTKRIVQKISR